MAEKEGYDYFMIKEINRQATAVRNTLTEKGYYSGKLLMDLN